MMSFETPNKRIIFLCDLYTLNSRILLDTLKTWQSLISLWVSCRSYEHMKTIFY